MTLVADRRVGAGRLGDGRTAGAVVVVAGSVALLARPWLIRLPFEPVTALVVLFVVLGIVGATWPLPAGPHRPGPRSDGRPMGPLDDEPGADGPGADGPIERVALVANRTVRPVASRAVGLVTDGPATDDTVADGLGGGARRPAVSGAPLPSWLVLAIGLGAFGVGRLLAVGAVPVAPFVFRSVALNTLAAVSEEAFFRRLAYGVATPWGPVVAIVTSATLFAAVHVTVWGWGVLPLDLAAGLVLSWQRWASGRWSVSAATHAAANVLAVI